MQKKNNNTAAVKSIILNKSEDWFFEILQDDKTLTVKPELTADLLSFYKKSLDVTMACHGLGEPVHNEDIPHNERACFYIVESIKTALCYHATVSQFAPSEVRSLLAVIEKLPLLFELLGAVDLNAVNIKLTPAQSEKFANVLSGLTSPNENWHRMISKAVNISITVDTGLMLGDREAVFIACHYPLIKLLFTISKNVS